VESDWNYSATVYKATIKRLTSKNVVKALVAIVANCENEEDAATAIVAYMKKIAQGETS